MEFLEKLGDTISLTGKQVTQKLQETTELARLNAKLLAQKDKVRTAYYEIGERFYKDQEECPVGYEKEFEEIKEANERIAILKKKIGKVKGHVTCPYCGNKISGNSYFCSICGKRREGNFDADTEFEE